MKQPSTFTKTSILKATGVFIAFLNIVFLLAPFTILYPITFGLTELFGFSVYYAFFPALMIIGLILAFRGKLGDILGKKFYVGAFVAILGLGLVFGYVGKNALGEADLIENYASLFGNSEKSFVIDLSAASGLIYYSLTVVVCKNIGESLHMTIAVVLIAGGLVLAFLKPLSMLASKIAREIGNAKAKRKSKKEIKKRTKEYQEAYVNETMTPARISFDAPSGSEIAKEDPLPSRFVANHEHPKSDFGTPQASLFVPRDISVSSKQLEMNGLRTAFFTFDDEPDQTKEEEKAIEETAVFDPFASTVEEKTEEEPAQMAEEPSMKEEPLFIGGPFIQPAPTEEESVVIETPNEKHAIDDLLSEESEEPMFIGNKPKETVVAKAAPSVTPPPAIEEPKQLSEEEKAMKELHQEMAKPLPSYTFPSLDLLQEYDDEQNADLIKENCDSNVEQINKVLTNLNVGAKVIGYTIGPSVTRYNIQTNDDVSVSSISKVIKDICVRLGGQAVRFEEIVRGQSTSGLEIPNAKSRIVSLKEMMSEMSSDPKDNMIIPFGVSISGECVCGDLSKFPHMLVAGTTGSGKSIFMHGLIMSLIMRNRPEDCQIVLIDPKRVEMTKYKELPHLLCPIIKEPSEAKVCMDKLIEEMERRFRLFEAVGCRDIRSFNGGYAEKKGIKKIPFIVVFIDEYADLVDTCKNIGESVVRLAQKARAAGINLVIATQRPSVQVITGVIKANIPVRVALSMSSAIDSMTIINQGGAEDLVGHGDMLIDCSLIARTGFTRAQGCLVLDEEIERVVDFIKTQGLGTMYDEKFLDLVDHEEEARLAELNAPQFDQAAVKAQSDAGFYSEIKRFVMAQEYTSISKIQRTFNVGFPRAGKILQQLQNEGIVAMQPDSPSSAKGCRVLIHQGENSDLDDIKLGSDN